MSNKRFNQKPPPAGVQIGIKVLRTYSPDENFPCHAGGGACRNPAVEAHDDGNGKEFLVCAEHLKMIHEFADFVKELGDAELKALTKAIRKSNNANE